MNPSRPGGRRSPDGEAASGAVEERTIHVGEELRVSVPSNPTTGYDWHVDFPSDRLRLERREHSRSSARIGAGGTTRFLLRAVRTGTASVHLRYLRPWEGRPVDERWIRVRIEPKG